ncbi:MAG: alpha/beta fold hydrolase [Hyphomicrobiales bacterium]|nr:alpha/beta fold hydrolase [Hyphomicrobiales bacterium]
MRVGGNLGKPHMVFWPSLLLDGSMWAYQFEHFAPNYRIALIDPPGIGDSTPLRRPITVDESATCLRQILDGLQIKTCIIIGNSWGSLTAAVFAADHPEQVLAAILTNGTAAPPTPEILAQMTDVVANLEQCEAAPDWLLTAAQQAFSAHSPKPDFMAYLSRVLREDPVSIAFAMKNILLGRKDLTPTMARIRDVPMLVIAGEDDHVFDVAQSQGLADSISGADFVLLPKTGHLAPRENPEAVNAAIDAFLMKLSIDPKEADGPEVLSLVNRAKRAGQRLAFVVHQHLGEARAERAVCVVGIGGPSEAMSLAPRARTRNADS